MTDSLSVPGSKSMTQRALIIGALSEKPRRISNALLCDDSERLTALLRSLGAGVSWAGNEVEVAPAKLRSDGARIDCGSGGTTARFGAALSLVTDGAFILDGDSRMRERPVRPLVNALRLLGVRVESEGREGFLPMRFERRDEPGARASIVLDVSASSQYASALMLVGARLREGLDLELEGDVVSRDYLEMTAEMMSRAGARVGIDGRQIVVGPGGYPNDVPLAVEADWSSASFLLAASWIGDVRVEIEGLTPPDRSIQGDSIFPKLLSEFASGRDHTFDLSDTPDLVAPLAAAALFASHPTAIRGIAHARLKESDRISALVEELRKLGASVEERTDGFVLQPLGARSAQPATLTTRGDHRLAMAFGVIGLRIAGVAADNPDCVSKSYPGFWEAVDKIRSARESR